MTAQLRLASLEAELRSLRINVAQLQARVHQLEEEMDTFVKTPIWKRLLFCLDGWPLTRLAERPQRRPWHWRRP